MSRNRRKKKKTKTKFLRRKTQQTWRNNMEQTQYCNKNNSLIELIAAIPIQQAPIPAAVAMPQMVKLPKRQMRHLKWDILE